MFAEVVLNRRVPTKFESVTYAVPLGLEVRPGQLVRVPFRKQKLAGIVRKLHEKTPVFSVREIAEILPLKLADWQLQLMCWIRENHECSWPKVVSLFIPKSVWKQMKDRSKN